MSYRETNAPVPNIVARSLNTPFQPSLTRAVFVNYTIEVVTLAGVFSGGIIELVSDSANPPTTVRATLELTANTPVATTYIVPMSHIVPPGDWVELDLTVVGGGIVSIVTASEVLI